jgi:hypothetical protein
MRLPWKQLVLHMMECVPCQVPMYTFPPCISRPCPHSALSACAHFAVPYLTPESYCCSMSYTLLHIAHSPCWVKDMWHMVGFGVHWDLPLGCFQLSGAGLPPSRWHMHWTLPRRQSMLSPGHSSWFLYFKIPCLFPLGLRSVL